MEWVGVRKKNLISVKTWHKFHCSYSTTFSVDCKRCCSLVEVYQVILALLRLYTHSLFSIYRKETKRVIFDGRYWNHDYLLKTSLLLCSHNKVWSCWVQSIQVHPNNLIFAATKDPWTCFGHPGITTFIKSRTCFTVCELEISSFAPIKFH